MAGLGVSCVGFAIVLHRLSRIEGKLDQLLEEIKALHDAVEAVHQHQEAISMARVRSAADSLERAFAADTADNRRELARRARDIFQESRLFYLELYKRAEPLSHLDVPIGTVQELHGRYVAGAIGELQAEFVGGDMGAYRHAVEVTARDFVDAMGFDPVAVFRTKSDAACQKGVETMAIFQTMAPSLTSELRDTAQIVAWPAPPFTSKRNGRSALGGPEGEGRASGPKSRATRRGTEREARPRREADPAREARGGTPQKNGPSAPAPNG